MINISDEKIELLQMSDEDILQQLKQMYDSSASTLDILYKLYDAITKQSEFFIRTNLASLENSLFGGLLRNKNQWAHMDTVDYLQQQYTSEVPSREINHKLLQSIDLIVVLNYHLLPWTVDKDGHEFLDGTPDRYVCPICGSFLCTSDSMDNLKDKCDNCNTLLDWSDYIDDDDTDLNNKEQERKNSKMKIPKISFKKIAIVVIVALLLGTFIPCIQVIPAGTTGIMVTMGKVDKNLIQPGPTFKLPFVQDIKTVDNKQQTYKFSDRIWGESSEQTVVYMEGVAVSYQIMPEYSVWLYTNVTDYQTNALPPTIVASAMKAAMVELKTDSVTNRAQIEPIAVDKLQKALNDKYEGREVVHITSLNIDNMDFEDNYNQAIEQRQIAKLNYEKQQTEIKTQLEKAEADKKEREIKASAEAKEKEIQAKAEADAIKTVADAQAEANKKLSQSLTKDLVDYQKVEKWDGKLPQVSGGSAIIDMKDSDSN